MALGVPEALEEHVHCGVAALFRDIEHERLDSALELVLAGDLEAQEHSQDGRRV